MQPKTINLLKRIDYKQERPWLTEINSLRILIGLLGLMLPALLWLFLLVDSGQTAPLPSISHYYFTRANPILIIVVSLLAIFLILYRYKGLADFVLSTLAGVFALCFLIFPTSNLCTGDCSKLCECQDHVVTMVPANDARELFHYLSAATFLGCLAAMSIFLFTKTNKETAPTQRKLLRNKFYFTFGVVMILAMLVIFPGIKIIPSEIYDANNLTFWMEAVAVEAFGISWLLKADVVLRG